MILQLNPPLPLLTPKGRALAHFVLDYGPEHHLMWICFNDADGECWTWENHKIRLEPNITMGRTYGKGRDQANAPAGTQHEPPMARWPWGPYVQEC